MQGVGGLHVVLGKLVARSQVPQLDRLCAQAVELAPELLLGEPRGVVAGTDRLDLLRHLGAQLFLDLGLLPPQLLRLRVVRTEPPVQARPLGPEVEQGEVQLLDARTIEEGGEQVAGRFPGEELVARLESDAGTFRFRELAREVRDPLADGLLLFVDGDARALDRKAAERRLGAFHLLPRLFELAPEELLGRDVVAAPRLLVAVQVRLGVRRREKRREGGVRGREAHLHDIGSTDLLDLEVAHVAIDERRTGRRPTRRLALGISGRGALEAARTDEPRQGLAEREQAAQAGARMEEGLVRRQPVLADDPLRKIPALQRRHLRADEGERRICIAVAVGEPEHVAVEAQLDGGLPRDLQARRRGVEARRQERDEDRQAYGDPEARDREPAAPGGDREVVARGARSAGNRSPPAAASAPLNVSPRVTGYEPGFWTQPSTSTLPAGETVMTSPGRTRGLSPRPWSTGAWSSASRSRRTGAEVCAASSGETGAESATGANSTTRPASLAGPPAAQIISASVARGRVRG